MLVIWTKCAPAKTSKLLSPILRTSYLKVDIRDDFMIPEGTTMVLALGSESLKHLQTLKVLAKNRTTTSYRTLHQMVGGVPVLVSYSPDISEINYGYYVDLLTDVNLAVRFCLTGKWVPVYGDYAYVPDFSDLCQRIEAEHVFTQETVDVSMDLETLGLDPYASPTLTFPGAYIVTVQATNRPGRADVLRFADRAHEMQRLADPVLREQLDFLLNCPYVRLKGANFKFDLHWLWVRAGLTSRSFTFDTTIVGSLLDENRSNALDMHVKMYVPKLAGYCVTPETRLLTADMQWVKAEEIQEDDELVGFEENPQFKRRRQLDVAKVTAIKSLEKRCYRITMKSGRSLTVSDNHQFLHVRDIYGGKIEWIQTEEIVVGMRLKTFPMRQFDESFDSGWMSGILDGEGWGSRSKTPTGTSYKIGWAQKKGKVLTRSLTLAAHWGLKFSAGSQEVKTPSVTLFSWDGFELLQLTRPVRLVWQRKWVKTPLPTRNRDDEDVVVSKELVGKQEVLAITTTTHTFIAEGMCSHNSDQFDREVDKSRMDQVPAEKLLPYAGGDVDGDLQVASAMKKELLKDPRLTSFYVNILHPAARAFEWVEQGGILVDKPAFQELKADLEAEHAALVKQACKIMGGRIVVKHGDATRPGGMNLTKASMLCDFMFSPMGLNLKPKMYTEKPDKDGIKRPSTAMEHLEMFADVPEAKAFIDLVRTDSGLMKTYNTYVVGFLEHLRSDGRFHPNYFLYVGNHDEGEGGAKTGRLSCKAPAFQCMTGNTLVLTNDGLRRLDWLVDQKGAGLQVLTHTGQWKPIVGVYENGVQPVFQVAMSNGLKIVCTANHPVLTKRGWVRTDQLVSGDVSYAYRPQNAEVYEFDLLFVDSDEESLQQSDIEGLAELRRSGDQSVSTVDVVRRFSGRHGREAGEGLVHRTSGRERGLHEKELYLGQSEIAGQQSSEFKVDRLQRGDQDRSTVGSRSGDFKRPVALSTELGVLDGASLDEGEAPDRSAFEEVTVVSVNPRGERETFDLTIAESHSFVANGVIVHNTVPKHTKWAQRIRRCYPAPEGYVIVERDYAQGELRVVACIADETNMIAAYKAGRDLHIDTAAPFAGHTYESLVALEATDPHTYEETRQLGKAGNFGLVFGMKEDGFVTYAKGNYGVELTWDEAHEFRETFFKKYPKLLTYHEWAKSFARQNKYVRTPLGRIRHLPLIKSPNREVASKSERQAINSPVQGTLTDMVLWTVALEHRWGLSKIAPCFGCCHDSILNYVPEDKVESIITQQLDQMEQLPFEQVGWNPQLKFVADAKYGKNWGELTKFKRP